MRPESAVKLPCVVLGLETQIGLSVVRELGRAGVPVIGVAQQANAIGLRSRYLTQGITVEQPRSPALIAALQQIGREHGACPLLAVSEVNLLWLSANQQALQPLVVVVPPPAALAAVLDKHATLVAASQMGINIPSTWQPLSQSDIEAHAAVFPFPAVLKWSDPNAVLLQLEAAGLPLLKAEYVDNPAELSAALQRYAPLGAWPLVQQYCAGHGLGQFFYMKDGKAVRRFQHRRVCEWPPEGGFSSVCDAVPLSEHRELQERSIALLQHIGWSGVAMVEYRHDPATGASRLMEINGRFWGSFPLAMHCGAAFALLCYLDATGAPMDDLPELKQHLRCRMLSTEVKRLVRILLKPELIADKHFQRRPWHEVWRFVADFANPRARYYVASLSDPMPWVADIRNLVRRS